MTGGMIIIAMTAAVGALVHQIGMALVARTEARHQEREDRP